MKISVAFWITLITSIILLIASFFAPPVGVISSSTLTAVGELFAFGALGMLPSLISEGKSARIQRGNTTIEIGHNNRDNKTATSVPDNEIADEPEILDP